MDFSLTSILSFYIFILSNIYYYFKIIVQRCDENLKKLQTLYYQCGFFESMYGSIQLSTYPPNANIYHVGCTDCGFGIISEN